MSHNPKIVQVEPSQLSDGGLVHWLFLFMTIHNWVSDHMGWFPSWWSNFGLWPIYSGIHGWDNLYILYTWYTCHMLWLWVFIYLFITLNAEKHFIHDLLSLIYLILTWYLGMSCCKWIVGCTWNHHWIGDLKLDPSIQPPVRSRAFLGTASEKGVVRPQIAVVDEK